MASERLRDRSHVGPRADVQLEADRAVRGGIAAIRDDVERVDERTPQGHLDADALTREPVRALAADLHRRRRGDRQLDHAAEAREHCSELVRARRRMPLEYR